MQTRTIAPAVDDSRLNIINALTKLATITTADPLDALRCIGILLAETCDVPTVYISQVNEIRIDHLIAFTKGNIATNTGQSRLEITPCATVALTKEITQYERVAEQFPEASYLQAVRASSYCGIPCLDQHGHVVGVACVLDERPRKYDTEDFDLFRIIGQRIGLEIVRRNDAEGLCLSRLHRLNRMAEMSLPKSGDSYEVFKNMVRIIGELFAVKVVCLSEIVGEELCFKSVYVNGETFRDAGRCPLATTPCATVESTKDLRVFDRVTEQFPQASFLRNHQAFTYCGFPILDSGGHVVAVVCLLDDKPHEFTDEDKELLKIFGQRTAVEIEHARQVEALKRTEEDLLASEELLRRVINSMSAHVAVLDKEGTIFAVNEAWDRFAHTNHANASSGVGIGVNYLDVCRLAASDDVLTRNVLHGIEEVQKGLRSSFEIEYPCHSPREERWFALRATPLSGSTGGIVVTHENITEWKRAEEA
ncbi:GAF domain-containing protein, partial [Petrachloros mirabilis]